MMHISQPRAYRKLYVALFFFVFLGSVAWTVYAQTQLPDIQIDIGSEPPLCSTLSDFETPGTIAFLSNQFGELGLMQPDGSNKVTMLDLASSNTGGEIVKYSLALSPDGASLAYGFRQFRDPSFGLHIIDTTTFATRELVPGGRISNVREGGVNRITWSPDGTQIAFVVDETDVYIYTLSGETLTQIASDLSEAAKPVWSDDSKHLFFADTSGIYIVEGDDPPRRIGNAFEFTQHFSSREPAFPDYQWVEGFGVYTRVTQDAIIDLGGFIDPISGEVQETGMRYGLRSPTGEFIINQDTTFREPPATMLFPFNADSLSEGIPIGEIGEQIQWSADGRYVLYGTNPGADRSRIHLVDLELGRACRVLEDAVAQFVWNSITEVETTDELVLLDYTLEELTQQPLNVVVPRQWEPSQGDITGIFRPQSISISLRPDADVDVYPPTLRYNAVFMDPDSRRTLCNYLIGAGVTPAAREEAPRFNQSSECVIEEEPGYAGTTTVGGIEFYSFIKVEDGILSLVRGTVTEPRIKHNLVRVQGDVMLITSVDSLESESDSYYESLLIPATEAFLDATLDIDLAPYDGGTIVIEPVELVQRNAVIEALNGYREENELSPFTSNDILMSAAQNRSEDQVGPLDSNFFNVQDFLEENEYTYENLWRVDYKSELSDLDPEVLVNNLWASRGFQRDILSPDYTEIGVGIANLVGTEEYHLTIFLVIPRSDALADLDPETARNATIVDLDREAVANSVIDELNLYREQNGLPPLTSDSILMATAQTVAENDAIRDSFGSFGIQSSLDEAGYLYEGTGGLRFTELSIDTVAIASELWSSADYEDLLQAAVFTEIGIGVAATTNGERAYFAIVLTKPKLGCLAEFEAFALHPDQEQATLDFVNQARADVGESPLVLSSTLNQAALMHSRDMAIGQFMRHRGSDGSMPLDRARSVGYPANYAVAVCVKDFETTSGVKLSDILR